MNVKILLTAELNIKDEDEIIGIKEEISYYVEKWQDMTKPIKIEIIDPQQENKEIEELFNEFWKEYPRKVDKVKSFKAFKRVCKNRKMLETLLAALAQHKKTEQWKNPKLVPHASTWLNGRRWEDDLTTLEDKPEQTASYDLEEYKRESLTAPLVYRKKSERVNA